MSQYIFGVDVGGTTVKLGLFDKEGNLLSKWEIPTRKEDNGSQIIPDIAEAILEKCQSENMKAEDIIGAGIGVPGPVTQDGVVNVCVNIGWGVVPITKQLSALIKMPVFAGNDANIAALGEMWKGGGEGYRNIVLATLGTGVGGGLLVDGKIVTGATGAGGEIGHMHVEDKETRVCNCGNKGCLEQYASATGITYLANKLLGESEEASLLRAGEVSAKAVFDAVKKGDKPEKSCWHILKNIISPMFFMAAEMQNLL